MAMRYYCKLLLLVLSAVAATPLLYSQEYDEMNRELDKIEEKEMGIRINPTGESAYTIMMNPSYYDIQSVIEGRYMPFSIVDNYRRYSTDNPFGLEFYAQKMSYPGLMKAHSLSMLLTYNYQRLTLTGGARMTRYLFNDVHDQYGLLSKMDFRISDNISAVMFAQMYNVNPYYSMAAFPFILSSQMGGYLSFQNGIWGFDVGARRTYDPFQGHWNTVPIVTPNVKWGKMRIDLPVGEMLYYMLKKK